MSTNNLSKNLQKGWVVILALFILTMFEFAAAVFLEGKIQILGLFFSGLLKAIIILQSFMHIGQLSKNISNLWWGIVLTFEDEEDEEEEEED